MKRLFAIMAVISSLGFVVFGLPHEPGNGEASMAKKPTLETLLSAQLESTENIEVIVSRVTIPPNTSLPKHWHPGEEFAYILEGSASLWMDGEKTVPAMKGDALKVPLKKVHTAMTGDEGATILVFRIHEKGKPERYLIE